jgi:hypothetical protein
MKIFLSQWLSVTSMLKTCSFIFTVALVASFKSNAQNLDEISLKKGINVNGSVNLNTVAYAASGIQQRRDPFNWFLTGGLNIDLFGYSAPFSFSYSNVNKSFSQPFNQFSFAPQYKWVKTYIGYNSMTFSPYTLAGHVFFGGGAELTPGKWRIAVMYGRLRKAVTVDVLDTLNYANASYKRMGYGMKVGYETNGNAVSFNVFTAKDDPASLPFVIPQNVLTPQQNVAMGLSGRKTFFRKFFVEVEYAVSVLNSNARANAESADSVDTSKNLLKGLLPENTTSRYFDALNGSVGYQGKGYAIQLKYERVAPEYQTLGAYYFNNDMRNITIAPSVRLLKNKMSLSANIGLQKNNLNQTRAATTLRSVGALNVQYAPSEKWNLAASYSNFSSYTNMRPQSDPNFQNSLDTLNFYQISETMTGSMSRSLGTKEKPQSIMWTGSYQKASNKSGYAEGIQLSDFMSTNVSYSYSIVPSNLTLSLSANVYTNNAAGVQSTFFGPTINTTKSFLEKTLRCSYATSYNQTSSNSAATSPVWNNQVSLSYAPKGKEGSNSRNNFSLGVNILRRLKDIEQQPSFTEATGTFNYTFTF